MKKSLDFGVQSYCFRNFTDNAIVAKKVHDIGLDKIELCGIHADFDKPADMSAVTKIYQNEGVQVVSIGVQTFEGADREKAWFECAAASGAKHISAHFRIESYMRAIPRVREWSREFGFKVGIHCHGGYMFGGQPDVLQHLIALGSPEIGLCIDTAWCMQIGPSQGNPVKWATDFAGSITGIHYKDFVFEPNAGWKDVIVGTGNLDLPAFVDALDAGGFDGMAVIEYEGDADNPDPALKRCVESMRSLAKK